MIHVVIYQNEKKECTGFQTEDMLNMQIRTGYCVCGSIGIDYQYDECN